MSKQQADSDSSYAEAGGEQEGAASLPATSSNPNLSLSPDPGKPIRTCPVRKRNLGILFISGVLLLIILIIIFVSKPLQNSHVLPSSQGTSIVNSARTVPRILWLHSSVGFDHLNMIQAIVAQHQIAIAKRSGYEVRIVDDFTAYNWLSPSTTEIIRKTKHSTQYFIHVRELLKLALLIEHGGVFMKAGQCILVDNLDWIEETLKYDYKTLQALQRDSVLQSCKRKGPVELMLFYKGYGRLKYYDDDVLIASKGARLLKEAFSEMTYWLQKGRRPYDSLQSFGATNRDRVISMQNFFVNLLNFKAHYWLTGKQLCRQYNVLSINKLEGSFVQQTSKWYKVKGDLLGDKSLFFKNNGKVHFFNYNLNALLNEFLTVVQRQNFEFSHEQSLFRQILEVEGNKWLMKPLPITRNVQFCIVSLKPLSTNNYQKQINNSLSRLYKQTFKKWKAVYFVRKLPSTSAGYLVQPLVKLVNASEWEGLNLQRAATKYCHEGDIALLLDFDQSLQTTDSLRILANNFKNRGVYGAFVSTKVGSKVTAPYSKMKFDRKLMETNNDNYRMLAQHFRVFSLYAYRLVPTFELHDMQGRYYNRQLPFFILVQLATPACPDPKFQYFLKRVEKKIEIPKERLYLDHLIIQMPAEKTYKFDSYEYKSKVNGNTWCFGAYYYLERLHQNLDNLFIFNNGSQFTGVQNRKNLPQLIPKKIHQIWVGNKPPAPHKKILMDNIRRLHPNYEYKLWVNENITEENFPQTYNLIQMLLRFSKVSPKNKMAMVADLMRLEIVYRHGGFYLDTNYHIFKHHTFDNWVSYKAVMPGQLVPTYKFARDNGFFGCMQGFSNIQRLLDHRALSQRMLFDWEANLVTGPFYFTLAMQGMDELDEGILTLPFDYIYPCYLDQNHCIVPSSTPQNKTIFKGRFAYSKKCEDIYYWAFGINFMTEGGTWKK